MSPDSLEIGVLCLWNLNGGFDVVFEPNQGDVLMSRLDRITVNPKILNGQPCIRGMRLSVCRVVEAVATYPNRDELLAEYPELEPEDIHQALIFAANSLDDRVLDLDEGYETVAA